jgi:molecular chaperone DnaJ
MAKDYYEALGVPKNASQDDIKKAFRKKAHELHPDKGGDAEAFKQVNEAYQVLGDAQKRAQYDQFGHAAFQQGGAPGGSGFGGFGFNGVNINMDDLGDLEEMLGGMFGFGQRGGGGGAQRGRDLEMTVTVEFLDAVRGIEREINVRSLAACEACEGTGAEGKKTVSCLTCGGQGRVTRAQRTPFGVIQTAAACPECRGRGKKPEKKCHTCDGSGVYASNRTLSVRIPAGIADGETIRLTRQGDAAPYGGTPGDLYIHIRVTTHPRFRREQNDIHSQELAPLSIFLLGGTIAVETVNGPVDLKVPAATSSGTVFKLRGQGFPYLHGHGQGDHLVTLTPDIPKKLSKEQRQAIEELKRAGL